MFDETMEGKTNFDPKEEFLSRSEKEFDDFNGQSETLKEFYTRKLSESYELGKKEGVLEYRIAYESGMKPIAKEIKKMLS